MVINKTDYRRNELLSKMPKAEDAVCRALRSMGLSYVRQYPIFTGRSRFYADIYIPSLRLIIEVDGGYHETERQRRLDVNRSACIRRLGLHVYRMPNRDAYHPERVAAKITAYKRRSGMR